MKYCFVSQWGNLTYRTLAVFWAFQIMFCAPILEHLRRSQVQSVISFWQKVLSSKCWGKTVLGELLPVSIEDDGPKAQLCLRQQHMIREWLAFWSLIPKTSSFQDWCAAASTLNYTENLIDHPSFKLVCWNFLFNMFLNYMKQLCMDHSALSTKLWLLINT